MMYIKQGEVVKAVADTLAGTYVSAGWKEATKAEYDKSLTKIKTTTPTTGKTADADTY